MRVRRVLLTIFLHLLVQGLIGRDVVSRWVSRRVVSVPLGGMSRVRRMNNLGVTRVAFKLISNLSRWVLEAEGRGLLGHYGGWIKVVHWHPKVLHGRRHVKVGRKHHL